MSHWWLAVACAGLLSLDCHAREEPEGSGWVLYRQHCANCHGPDGGGYLSPAIIGPGSALESYGDAQGLLHYISTTMPQNKPGSLSEEAYRELLTLLLIENRFVPPDWSPDSAGLSAVPLTK